MSGPARVAIVVHAHVPGDPRIRRQADALVEAGYEVDVIALRSAGEPADERTGRVRIVRLPVSRGDAGLGGHVLEYLAFTAMATWRLAREHRSRRYALVQIATVPDFLAFAGVPQKLGGVPLLLDLHEDMPAFFRDRFTQSWARLLMPLVSGTTRASAAVVDALITVHEPLRRLSIERGVDPERIGVVMNSADGRLFDPARHSRRPFMADGTLRIVHHSNLQRIYGIDRAITALAGLNRDLTWRLDVYGDGPWRQRIEAAISTAGLNDRVTLHGRVPIDDLPGILAESDIGLVPSLAEPYLEYSLSTKLLEYAAMGVPAIVTDLATTRAHFTDAAVRYVNGHDLESIARAVEALAADPSGTVAMGLEAQRQARAYDWETQKRRYLEVVDALISRRSA